MGSVSVCVRRPNTPADALSSDLSDVARVQALPNGRIEYGMAETSAMYNEDPTFLRAIIAALVKEVSRLERGGVKK